MKSTKRIPTLEIIQDQKNDKHESVFIDEIKLTALKKSLIDNEIQVGFESPNLWL